MENAELITVPSMKVIAVKNAAPDEEGDDAGKRKRDKTDEGTPKGKKGKKRA